MRVDIDGEVSALSYILGCLKHGSRPDIPACPGSRSPVGWTGAGRPKSGPVGRLEGWPLVPVAPAFPWRCGASCGHGLAPACRSRSPAGAPACRSPALWGHASRSEGCRYGRIRGLPGRGDGKIDREPVILGMHRRQLGLSRPMARGAAHADVSHHDRANPIIFSTASPSKP
jgi:hypothetical protein